MHPYDHITVIVEWFGKIGMGFVILIVYYLCADKDVLKTSVFLSYKLPYLAVTQIVPTISISLFFVYILQFLAYNRFLSHFLGAAGSEN